MTERIPHGAPGGIVGEQLRAFLTAVAFLTCLPRPAWVGAGADDLTRSAVYFPLVGLLIGVWSGGVFWLAAQGWPPFTALALTIASTAWLTGAVQEGALARVFDGGGPTAIVARVNAGDIGSSGVVAVALLLLLKLGALLTVGDVVRALIAGQVLSRWSSLPLAYLCRDVGGPATAGTAPVVRASALGLAVGSTLAAGIAAAALGARVLPVLAVAVALTALGGAYFKWRLGGVTAGRLGAVNQLVEVAVYLALAFQLRD